MAMTDAQVDEMVRRLRAAFRLPPFDKRGDALVIEMVERSGMFAEPVELELNERIREIARDAARYRWLRGEGGTTSVRGPHWKIEHWTGVWNPVQEKEMDAAVDAAMQADETANSN